MGNLALPMAARSARTMDCLGGRPFISRLPSRLGLTFPRRGACYPTWLAAMQRCRLQVISGHPVSGHPGCAGSMSALGAISGHRDAAFPASAFIELNVRCGVQLVAIPIAPAIACNTKTSAAETKPRIAKRSIGRRMHSTGFCVLCLVSASCPPLGIVHSVVCLRSPVQCPFCRTAYLLSPPVGGITQAL
jgi:hypothetical protein